MMAGLLTAVSTLLNMTIATDPGQLPAIVPKFIDCRFVKYCPNYSASCSELYREVGGPDNYGDLTKLYPCCFCSPPNTGNCFCGKNGIAVRDLSVKVPPTNPGVQIGTYFLITEYTNFKFRFEQCAVNSDCEDAQSCVELCKKLGIEEMKKQSRCCSCGPPMAGSCENCNCATNSTYAKVPLDGIGLDGIGLDGFGLNGIGVYAVGVSQASLVTAPLQIT